MGDADEREGADVIPLFGERFFPEGVAARDDGTLYVGSLATGEIVMVPPGMDKPQPFIPPGALGMVGILVDNTAGVLWACAVDLTLMAPGALLAFDATTGQEMANIPYDIGFCNDMTLDEAGNLYVADSFAGQISRLAPGGNTLEAWSNDPLFVTPQGEFGLNGLAFDTDAIYVVKTNEGALFRVPIEGDGSAGPAEQIGLIDGQLVGPDGVKTLDAGRLLIVDNYGGAVVQVSVNGNEGSVMTLLNYLDGPTTADIDGDDAWVAEGQFDHLFGNPPDPNPPNLPFMLRRVYLP
jgi:sugar lactone lactonase YvrE